MKIITLSITLTILALVNIAEASLFGRVVSISGEPVNGAMIKILPHGEVVWTNKDGYFKFEKARLDVKKINISRLGYATISRELNETELKNGYALIRLKPLPISMKGVVVTEKRKPGELRKNATPSLREMDGRQILEIPGANQDLLRSLTYLPGINTRSDYSSQLYVRGGGPEQNLILIDGITVSSPYRLGTFVSAFNPDLVEGIELLPGGFPAQYGNRLSSVLDIKYRTSEREGYSLISNTSLINTSSVFEGPLINQDGGFVLSVRRTYYDLILNQVTEDDVAFPYFYDVQGKIDYDFSEKFRGEVHLETATGGFKLKTDRDDDEDALNLDLRDKNSDGLLAFTLGYSPSDRFDVRTQISRVHRNEDFRIDGDLKLDVDVSGDRYSLKQDAIYQQEEDKYRLLFGWEYQNTNAHFGWTLTADDSLKQDAPPGDQNPFMPKQDSFGYEGGDIFTGGYTSFEYRDWEKFRPTIGFRYDWSDVVDKYKLSPRLALNYRINTQDMIKLAWGYYYQFPSYEILSEKGYFPETWRNSELDAEKAVHYLIGWEHIYDLDWKLRLDFYYKRLSDLVVDYDTTLIPVNKGRGDSEGFELYLEKRKTKNSRYSGWISYTLAKSWSETPWSSYYFISDQLHTLNIVSDIKFTDRISAGLTWRFGSGMPYTPVIGVEEISVTDSITGQPVVVDWEPVFGATNSVRFPAYHRLDVRINFAFKWYSLPCTAYIEAINTYNQKNVYSYNWDRRYTERETTHELPFIPSFGLIIKFF